MQETRRPFTVEVNLVIVCNHSEFAEIKICIQALQRIEGPGDPGDVLREYTIALRQLQFVTKVEVAVGRLDRKHVRMMHDVPAFKSNKTVDKTDKRREIVGAHENSPDFL